MTLSSQGQSTIEYLLIFSGVVVILIVFMAQPGAVYQSKLNSTFNAAADGLGTATNAFYNSF